jgi:2-isopropylmalate synthase/UPF0716 protein FxsA
MMMYIFLGYLFVEVLISVQAAGQLGGIGTFLEIIFSAAAGILLLRNFKTTILESLRAVSNNCITMKEFQELNIFALLGAILLILPGILSDLIGVLMQFSVFTALIMSRLNKGSDECKPNKGEENVIDVEIVSHDNRLK